MALELPLKADLHLWWAPLNAGEPAKTMENNSSRQLNGNSYVICHPKSFINSFIMGWSSCEDETTKQHRWLLQTTQWHSVRACKSRRLLFWLPGFSAFVGWLTRHHLLDSLPMPCPGPGICYKLCNSKSTRHKTTLEYNSTHRRTGLGAQLGHLFFWTGRRLEKLLHLTPPCPLCI